MVRAFVLAEIDSPHYGAHYASVVFGDVSLYEGDLSNAHANALRKVALSLVRGYGRDSLLFAGFPHDVSWNLASVSVAELEGFLYADCDPWLTLTKGSRLVGDGAANSGTVAAMTNPITTAANDSILGVEKAIRNGKTYPPLIAVAADESAPHVLAEGHTRATSYSRALDPEDEVEAIVGYSPALSTSRFFHVP